MVRASLVVVLTLLASCGGEREQRAPAMSETTPSTSEAASSADETREPVSPSSKPFFVGRWASEAANCREASWVITERELQTPGEVTCRFHRVRRTTRGAEVEATCFAEGPPEQWTMQFAYAQSARALLIEDAPFADIGLVRCDDSAFPLDSSSENSGEANEPFAKGPRGAANVLKKYYELLTAGRFEDASQLWTPSERGSAQQASEQDVAQYESDDVHIGEPGRIEGAAGSLYISIPVQIHVAREAGEDVHLSGEATLRRSNDVPGTTPEQRSWRIVRIELQPAAGG